MLVRDEPEAINSANSGEGCNRAVFVRKKKHTHSVFIREASSSYIPLVLTEAQFQPFSCSFLFFSTFGKTVRYLPPMLVEFVPIWNSSHSPLVLFQSPVSRIFQLRLKFCSKINKPVVHGFLTSFYMTWYFELYLHVI